MGLLLVAAAAPHAGGDRPYIGGTLIAAFITRTSIVLCSDGRVVNSATGAVVRDDWTKVHRLTGYAGMLTGGRDLPRLMQGIAGALAGDPEADVAEVAGRTRDVLGQEWSLLSANSHPPSGRAVAIVAGFDSRGLPRVFHLDSDDRPTFRPAEVMLFNSGDDLEVVAIATGAGADEDVSRVIIGHVDTIYRRQPRIDRERLFIAAFNVAKDELGTRNSRIGGRTFVADIERNGGFRDVIW